MAPEISGLRYVPSPDELAYQRLLIVIEATRQQAVVLQTDLEHLRDELGRFEATYHAHVGHRLVELNRLRLACDEFRQRIALRQAADARPADIEGDIERLFRGRRQTLADEQAESEAHWQAYDESATEPVDAETEAELRRIYRELARRHHPDLVQDPTERERRQDQMTRVNAAFRDRDLGKLREMLTLSPRSDDEESNRKSAADRLAWATAEVARLDEVVAQLRLDLASTRDSSTHELWRRSTQEPDLLDELTAQVERQIVEARERLEDLTHRFAALTTEDR
jgi:hypothetical protein